MQAAAQKAMAEKVAAYQLTVGKAAAERVARERMAAEELAAEKAALLALASAWPYTTKRMAYPLPPRCTSRGWGAEVQWSSQWSLTQR